MVVYIVTNKVNGKIYIGQTTQTLDERKNQHIKTANVLHKGLSFFGWAIKEFGVDNFEWRVLKRCKSIDELNYYEMFYIHTYRANDPDTGYNCNKGGGCVFGRKEMMLAEDKESILQKVILSWEKGKIKTAKELSILGCDANLSRRYRNSGWIESVGAGAFKLKKDKLDVYSFLDRLGDVGYVYGYSAINFIYTGKIDGLLSLAKKNKSVLPKFILANNKDMQVFSTSLLFDSTLHKADIYGFVFKYSMLERALFEMLIKDTSDENVSFVYSLILENKMDAQSIRDILVNNDCYYGAKRMYLYLLNVCGYTIDTNGINLGKGKRQFSKKGKFNAEYGITVPKNI